MLEQEVGTVGVVNVHPVARGNVIRHSPRP